MKLANSIHEKDKVQSILLIALLLTASLLVIVPLSNAGLPPVAPSGGEYETIPGVLDSDTYYLYPYEHKSLDVGFSKYGEMINPVDGVGLHYDGVDAFANPYVPIEKWSSGWVIDIHYLEQNCLKNVWAYALYTDWSGPEGVGGPWQQMQESVDASTGGDSPGGRRTSGWAITDDIRLIYDGPRRAVYLLNTTIYDKNPDYEGSPMVEITIQLVFNKVKKYVIEIKDIKRIDNDKWHSAFQIEFSQRGEWDLDDTENPKSYAEFYNNLTTKYDKHPFYCAEPVTYDLCQMISEDESMVGYAAFWPNVISKWVEGTGSLNREEVLTSMETTWEEIMAPTGSDYDESENLTISLKYEAISYPRGACEWSDEPWVFEKDGECWDQLNPNEWVWEDNTVVILKPRYGPEDEFGILYKRHMMGAKENHPAPLDEMPDDLFRKGWPQTTYGMFEEPKVPYVFAEWDFDLDYDDEENSTHQFRCVSVYGITDNHNAVDPDQDESSNEFQIDKEVIYQLNEVFNPYDLNQAAHKYDYRWTQKGTLPDEDAAYINLTSHLKDQYGNDRTCLLTEHEIIRADPWGYYCNDSEKVLLLDADGVLPPELLERPDDYDLVDADILLYIDYADYEDYDYYKVLYSTMYDCEDDRPGEPCEECPLTSGRWEWTVIGTESLPPDSTGTAMVSAAWQDWKNKQVWLSAIDYKEEIFAPNHPYLMQQFSDQYMDSPRYDYHFDHAGDDHRTAFMDDWCTPDEWEGEEIYPYAISSGNIIVVGGPLVNLAAEYFNDFTDAFIYSTYGEGYYAPGCWARTVMPTLESLTHQEVDMDEWPANELWYSSSTVDDDYGYSIVSTYKDINGTVGFIVYGYTADDTYYTCYALRGGLLEWLQQLQPGVTTVILEINYEDIHPVTFHVKECLGTFTECTGFGTNFKDAVYEININNAEMNVDMNAYMKGLCYKLVDIDWCCQVHPDP